MCLAMSYGSLYVVTALIAFVNDAASFHIKTKMHNSIDNSDKVRIIRALPPRVTHAEGPHYKCDEQAMYYVDTFAPAILRWDMRNGEVARMKLDGDSVGMVIPIKGAKRKFIVGRDRRLDVVTWDPRKKDTSTLTKVGFVDWEKPKNQFNDGKADRRGNLWLGTLTRNADLSVTDNGGSLYYFSGNDLETPQVKIPSTIISNGLAFSKNNKKFYFIDSQTKVVARFDYDENTNALSNKSVLFNLTDHSELKGIPDGMTIDSEDNLYVALFGGGAILKISTDVSHKDRLLKVIRMPVTYITSVTFGGPHLDTLYATTSRLHVKGEAEPDAGCIFELHGLNARGVEANEAVINPTYLSVSQ